MHTVSIKHPRVYALSCRYAPPGVDVREARLQRAQGDVSVATRPIRHQGPDDVSPADLEYYGDVWSSVPLRDALFYLHPVARCFAGSPATGVAYIHAFLHMLNEALPAQQGRLDDEDHSALQEGLGWVWKVAARHNLMDDWPDVPHLSALLPT